MPANLPVEALNPPFGRPCPQIGGRGPRREARTEGVSKEVKRLPRGVHYLRLLLVHSELHAGDDLFGRVSCFLSRTTTQNDESSSAGESHPHALTEPDVNLSTHPALIAQPSARDPSASGQTFRVADGQSVPTSAWLCYSASSTSCISSLPTSLRCDSGSRTSGKGLTCRIVHSR